MLSFGRTKMLLAFAFFGFLIGTTAYLVLDVLLLSSIGMQPMAILELFSMPWFLSGLIGALLSILIVYVSARYAGDG